MRTLCFFALSLIALQLEARTWTDIRGRQIEAEIVSATATHVTLLMKGQEFELERSKLSSEDDDYINTFLKEAKKEVKKNSLKFEFAEKTIIPGKRLEVTLPLDEELKKLANQKSVSGVSKASIAIAFPPGFDPAKTYPILLVSATSDGGASSAKHMKAYYKTANQKGWIVIGADNSSGAPKEENIYFRWALAKTGLKEMHRLWPNSKTWPIACGGNSGGAKWSGRMAAIVMKEGYEVIGMFMSGCNQSTVGYGLQNHKPRKSKFKKVPIFLSSGSKDTIATPQMVENVEDSMKDAGFRRTRLERHSGGHGLDTAHVAMALDWFLKLNPIE